MIRTLTLCLALGLAACGDAPDAPDTAEAAEAVEAAPAANATTPTDLPRPMSAARADGDLPVVTVFKTPTCGCCSKWVEHLRANGFEVRTNDMPDLSAVKAQYGIPGNLSSCHTGIVAGYVVEGHVPADDVKRLLAERPDVRGLSVPGMPIGSPGMEVEGRPADAYDVLAFGPGGVAVFEHHEGG